MKKLSTKYFHESTGITFEIEFKDGKKRITIKTSHDDDEFMFRNSKPETLITVASALLEIGQFCANMEVDDTKVNSNWKAVYREKPLKVFYGDDLSSANLNQS